MTETSDFQYYYSHPDGTPVFEFFIEGKQYLYRESKGTTAGEGVKVKDQDNNANVIFP